MPGLVLRFLGHPAVVAVLYCLFVGNLFLHGLVIWSGAIERISAVAVGLLAVGVTVAAVRRGSFTPRAVVELRDDRREQHGARFSITVKGEPTAAKVRPSYADRDQTCQAAVGDVPEVSALRGAEFDLAPSQARAVKVWVHQISREGQSERMAATVEVASDRQPPRHFDLRGLGEHVVVPVSGQGCRVTINLNRAESGVVA